MSELEVRHYRIIDRLKLGDPNFNFDMIEWSPTYNKVNSIRVDFLMQAKLIIELLEEAGYKKENIDEANKAANKTT